MNKILDTITFITIILLVVLNLPLTGEDKVDILPVIYGNTLKFEDQSVRGAGGGVIVLSGDLEEQDALKRDNLQFVALYIRHDLKEDTVSDCPTAFNNVEFLIQKKRGRHQYFSLLKSYSDKPVYGGFETFNFAGGYGYEVISKGDHSLWLGGSLVVSDCGLASPVLPFPFLHYDFSSRFFDASFDFTTSPMFDIVIAPDQKFHLNGSMIMTDMEALGDKGMKYDVSLEYRFFVENHPMGDFAGIRLGFLAEDYEYDLSSGEAETLQIAWKSLYGTLDLSLLEFTAGYTIDGEECCGSGAGRDLGSGMYLNLQLAWLF